MRNLVVGGLLSLGLLFTSCLDDEFEGPNTTLEYLATDSIQVDSVYSIRTKIPFKVFYTLPASNYSFYNFQDIRTDRTQDSVQEVAVVVAKKEGISDNTVKAENRTLVFSPSRTGKYVFKFYSGKTPGGTPTFVRKEIRVE
ncbi:hypothetical protein [Vaginella massiliensis]|uniref:hypothetical protein n=1 Tax=Vaginella massiliensis TaxID=1816680 RepID=UPI000837C45A|nr:hypothetical protein [Vaginella massiliensis]